jgi:arylsulfatase
LIDIMATCVDVAAAQYPETYAGHAVEPLEGRSLIPALHGETIQRDALYWEHEGNAAIRVGDWKLVRFGRNGAWELYDLKSDRTEQHDLAAAEPARVKELAAKWSAWADRAHVRPLPKPLPKGPGNGQGKGKGKAKGQRNGQGEPANKPTEAK